MNLIQIQDIASNNDNGLGTLIYTLFASVHEGFFVALKMYFYGPMVFIIIIFIALLPASYFMYVH